MYKCNSVCEIDEDDNKYNTLNFHNDNNQPPSHHQPASNYLSIVGNYAEPNSPDVRDGVVVRCFSLWRPRKSNSKKNRNKPVITARSDGSGVIRVGTLQAVIPSNNTPSDQGGFRIVPSITHESYVDVVK